MFEYLKKDSWQIFWIIFHAALGFACTINKWPIIVWYYILIITAALSFLISKINQQHVIIYLLAYSLGIEVIGRGLQAAPFIPDQLAKYLAVILFALGLASGGPIKKISIYGFFMLLLSIPALTIAPDYTRKQIVFNYFGPLSLFLGVMFCSRQIMTFNDLKKLIRIMILPIFSLACYTFLRASEFEKIEYSVYANYDASGGSITNQVSTLFGTAICLILVLHLSKQQLFRFKVFDYLLLGTFLIRGLLTFSRGGMVSAALAIIAVVFFPKAQAAWQDSEIGLKKISPGPLFMGLAILVSTFLAVNMFTNNFLLYRYQGKTERNIQSGFESGELDVDQLTTGRYTILLSDVNMFLANPAIGVGVGHSSLLRPEYGGPEGHAAHLEISRLLAEHGIPGLVLIIMIYVYPFYKARNEPNNYRKVIMIVFLIMGLTATFHSAMRTMITPLLFSFAFINFVPTDYDWRLHLNARRVVDTLGQSSRKRSKESASAIPS